jgi:3'-5' exoribonuclease
VDVTACYILHDARRAETKQSKPYLKLLLGDRSGTIDGFVWDDADRWEPLCVVEEVVGVRARVGSYQDRLQLRIASVEPLRAGPADLEHLLPSSPRPRDQMERELDQLIASVADRGLRKLLQRCLGRGAELGRAFRAHPAAKRNHHAYLGGLLEHSLSVATVCDRLAAHYRDSGVRLDRDLLVAGALLHDIGKLRELKGFPAPGYTTEGQLLGHIVIGIQMVGREAEGVAELASERLLLLLHLIASHQGKPEWDSPKVPQLLEGLVLHYADDLDAKLNQAGSMLAGVSSGEWSAYDRSMERAFFQPPELKAAPEVEAVPSEEAAELLIDLFRS